MENILIIDSKENLPLWLSVRDGLLTVILWILYFYLIRDGIIFVSGLFLDLTYHESAKGLYALQKLSGYMLTILIGSIMFIGWAVYCRILFSRHKQQNFIRQVNTADLGELYGIAEEKVVIWQNARILSVSHDELGNMLEVLVLKK